MKYDDWTIHSATASATDGKFEVQAFVFEETRDGKRCARWGGYHLAYTRDLVSDHENFRRAMAGLPKIQLVRHAVRPTMKEITTLAGKWQDEAYARFKRARGWT